ncbi:acyltransferase [Bacillus sp. FJAT-27245]|uniref:acyltransferase n=1 Tax=Bacillus sp. FJAT-27245 TaxID=1684144 RepID=UPI0006A7A207|nr:acyltransferase [Bacillus sp. FJAT-27245]
MGLKHYVWGNINKIQASPIFPKSMRNKLLRTLKVKIDKTSSIAEDVFIGSSNLVMGKDTFINVGSFLDGCAPIILEDYVRIGPYVKILTGTHKYRNSVIRRNPEDGTIAQSVIIKTGTWIGLNVTILPGVTIREGCIIGAGSVVVKDTLPNGLYVGNPAKRIKDLPVD